jgi:hypothetical protein
MTVGLLALLVGGCAAPRPALDADGALDPDRAPSHYARAVADARTATPAEIVTTLTPVHPSNDRLVWQDTARQVVRVVTWTDGLTGATPGDTLRLDDPTWVTVVPAVQRFCQDPALPKRRLALRLEQLLGLPPDARYTRFVELWVPTRALFRPCPDPEITDRECELTFPAPTRRVTVSAEHKRWIRSQRAARKQDGAYPWTGLGYTYDWNPATDDVGLSEFVVPAGAPMAVHRTASTAAYCRP